MTSELSLFACIYTFFAVQVGVLGSLKSYLVFTSLWVAWKTGIASVYNLVYSGIYSVCGAVCFFLQTCFMNWSGCIRFVPVRV